MKIPRIKLFSREDKWDEEEIKLYKKNEPGAILKGGILGTGLAAGTYYLAPELGKEVGMTNAMEESNKVKKQHQAEVDSKVSKRLGEIKEEVAKTEENVRTPFRNKHKDLESRKAKSDSVSQEINNAEAEALQKHKEQWHKGKLEGVKKAQQKGYDKEKTKKLLEEIANREAESEKKIKAEHEAKRKKNKEYISEEKYKGAKEELARQEAEEIKNIVKPLKNKRGKELGKLKSTLTEEAKNKSREATKNIIEKEIKSATKKMKVLGYGAAGVGAAGTYLSNRRKRTEL